MSMLQELHEAHLARQRRLGAGFPEMKREPKPLVPEKIAAPVKISAPVVAPKPSPQHGCILDLMMGGSSAPALLGPSMHSILEEVASKHKVTLHMIRCKQRTQWIADIRQEFYYRAAAETVRSYPEIGRFCGGRDHTTILYGVSAYCYRHNLPHPRDARDTIYDRKQRQRERYRRVIAELRAQNEAQA